MLKGALAAAATILIAASAPAPTQARPEVMLMTGLPLVWGEKGPFDPGSRPAAAYAELQRQFDFRSVDVLDPETLARGRFLFLAQPKRLAPSELAALDGWIRGGGRALILTDPMLTWPSELPPGDIGRPPPVGLLAPLLGHWGLTLRPPTEAGEIEADWDGRRILLDSPGRLARSGTECAVEQYWTALCRLGSGGARVVADADLLSDSLWQRRSADNRSAVAKWLHETRAASPRPARHWSSRYGWVLLMVVLGVLIRVLLARLRTR